MNIHNLQCFNIAKIRNLSVSSVVSFFFFFSGWDWLYDNLILIIILINYMVILNRSRWTLRVIWQSWTNENMAIDFNRSRVGLTLNALENPAQKMSKGSFCMTRILPHLLKQNDGSVSLRCVCLCHGYLLDLLFHPTWNWNSVVKWICIDFC